MKVKLRFIPLNQISKDTVAARGIKHVLDLTLNTSKLWKTVTNHVIGKWSGIEELSDKLELFIDGSQPPKSELFSSYKDISIAVESVISSSPSFQALKSNSAAEADEVPIIPIYYNIKELKIAVNVLMSPSKRKDTPYGYSLADESWLHAFDMFNDTSNGGQQEGSPERQDVKSNNSSSSGCIDNPNEIDIISHLPHTDSLFGQIVVDGQSLMGHSLMGGGLVGANAAAASTSSALKSKDSKDSSQRPSPRIFDAVKQIISRPYAKAPSILESEVLAQQPAKASSAASSSSSSVNAAKVKGSINNDTEEAATMGKRSSAAEDRGGNDELAEKPKQPKRVRFSAEVLSPAKQKSSIQAIRTISQGHSIPSMSMGSTQVNPATFKALFSRVGRTNPTWKRIRPTYIGPITR